MNYKSIHVRNQTDKNPVLDIEMESYNEVAFNQSIIHLYID